MAATYDRAYGRADYPPSMDRWARHSAYSDPGRHAALLDQAEPDITTASMVAQNLIAHYRFASTPLPESSNDDINARWLSTILEIDQQRHGAPLTAPRPEAERVQGCCRDHTLIAVGILRQHGVPARSRVGFADYLRPESRVDHVVAEAWLGGRWVRFDPGLAGPRGRVSDPHDIVVGNDSPFLTAATAWSGYRRRGRPIDDLGVRVGPVEFTGPPFVLSYLIMDVAHRFGDELLLWDFWGAMPLPGAPIDYELGDVLAKLVQRADRHDETAELTLLDLYQHDPRIRAGDEIVRHSPRGAPPVRVSLIQRSTSTRVAATISTD